MDRDLMFGLTEEDLGYDEEEDDELYDRYGAFTAAPMFSGSSYGASMTGSSRSSYGSQGGYGSQSGYGDMDLSASYMSPDMALEAAIMAMEEDEEEAEMAQANLQAVAQGNVTLAGFDDEYVPRKRRTVDDPLPEGYWDLDDEEDDDAFPLFGFGEF